MKKTISLLISLSLASVILAVEVKKQTEDKFSFSNEIVNFRIASIQN